jgi:hypothetical protein
MVWIEPLIPGHAMTRSLASGRAELRRENIQGRELIDRCGLRGNRLISSHAEAAALEVTSHGKQIAGLLNVSIVLSLSSRRGSSHYSLIQLRGCDTHKLAPSDN